MVRKYKTAKFEPRINPDWAWILNYTYPEDEANILLAILEFPKDTGLQNDFWEHVIKPDLEVQYSEFTAKGGENGVD